MTGRLLVVAAALCAALAFSLTPAPAADRDSGRTLAGYAAAIGKRSVSLDGVVPDLANKARAIVAACGSRVIAAVADRYINGHGPRSKRPRISLHAAGKAVDMADNPDCIYRQLLGWRGGYSVDYWDVRPHHVHISLDVAGGREMRARFVHGGGRYKLSKKLAAQWAGEGERAPMPP